MVPTLAVTAQGLSESFGSLDPIFIGIILLGIYIFFVMKGKGGDGNGKNNNGNNNGNNSNGNNNNQNNQH